jgi:hypothetical protein
MRAVGYEMIVGRFRPKIRRETRERNIIHNLFL